VTKRWLTEEQFAAHQANRDQRGGQYVDTALERDVLSAILDYLPLCPRVAWHSRMNSGGMVNPNGQYVRFAFRGCPDIIGQLKDGRFFCIEAKRPGKNATPEQWEFLCKVNRNMGVGFVATSVDDVRKALG